MGLDLPVIGIRTLFGLAALVVALCAPLPIAAQTVSAQPKPGIERPLILVPGLLGSRLCRPDPNDPKKTELVWGTLGALRQFPTIRLSHAPGASDPIKPCGIVREIVYLGLYSQDVYTPIIRHLEADRLSREPRPVSVFV